ncbi:MAG: endonuclease/exonuclease/phosphatase family protein [Chitinophagales bacterium]
MRKFLIFLHIVSSLLMVASAFSSSVNPTDFWCPAFLGLLFPILFFIQIGWIVFWLFFKKKRTIFISIITLIICYKSIGDTIAFSAAASHAEQVSIMTWNVKNFDLYNWSNNEDSRDEMFALIEEKSPDILCLQEFYNEKNGDFQNIKDLKKQIGYDYAYFVETFCLDNGARCWGLATFSKFPIEKEGFITFETASRLNSCIYTDINIDDEIVRIYNTHLQSIHLGQEDYEYIENAEPNLESSRQIAIKLKNGFVNRAKQAIQVFNHRDIYEGRTMLCGDFNDTPVSFAYYLLSKNMQDAFCEKGLGMGSTYAGKIPFLRIDYTLLDETFEVKNYKIYRKNYSDHYPTQTYFTL